MDGKDSAPLMAEEIARLKVKAAVQPSFRQYTGHLVLRLLGRIAELERAQTFKLTGACGTVSVAIGTRFASDGVVWEIVGKPAEPVIYSPSGLGGTPSVRCKVITGTPDGRFTPHMENGEVDWCGDSVASAILAPHKYGRLGKLEEELAAEKARADAAERDRDIFNEAARGENLMRLSAEAERDAAVERERVLRGLLGRARDEIQGDLDDIVASNSLLDHSSLDPIPDTMHEDAREAAEELRALIAEFDAALSSPAPGSGEADHD